MPVGGAELIPVPGALPGDAPVKWSGDGKALFLRESGSARRAQVVRCDVRTGQRTAVRGIVPLEPAGARIAYQPVLALDGEVYFYTVYRCLENLYLVEGLR